MGLNVRLEKLTNDEVYQLAHLDVTSIEGERIRSRAGVVCVEQRLGPTPRGRWPLLMWFARQERIISESELAEALSRYR